ncbi:MAG: VanZ family protein [Ruminococcaceae bacterium]|nr:VanZ family protein [Oscillospiraceae bacterium]
MAKKIILWVLIILWMSVIFAFSNQQATQSKKVSSGVIKTVVKAFDFNDSLSEEELTNISEKLTFVVRKGAHFSAYALLGLLIAMLLKEYNILKAKQFLLSIGIAFLYACSDEIHQIFVKGRSGEVRDVIIDTCGAIFGVLILKLIIRIKNKAKIKR